MKSYYNCSTKVYETEGRIPKMSHMEDSFTAMLDLHCLDIEKEIEDKDKNYFSSLENTGWLRTVSATLQMASEVASDVVNVGFLQHVVSFNILPEFSYREAQLLSRILMVDLLPC